MSTESILKPVLEIKGDEAAQRLLDVLDGPVIEIPRPSTDTVRGLDGGAEYIEHALVANNFVITIGGQMVAGQERVFERVRYRLPENNCWDMVPECWVVDWKEKHIEIYSVAEAHSEEIEKYLKKTVTEENKENEKWKR